MLKGRPTRAELLDQAFERTHWDLIVIGGGATGLGVALDATARGYSVLLLERDDFAKGTSSRSSKLVHGGLRYLKNRHFGLVMESLRERGLLIQNAPHLVRPLRFILPAPRLWKRLYYWLGLTLYSVAFKGLKLGPSRLLGRRALKALAPTLKQERLSGGALYFDAQMDDARLGLTLAKTAVQLGATILNYCEVTGLEVDEGGQVSAVRFTDCQALERAERVVKARAVVNATGVFVDEVRRLEGAERARTITPSQGAHLVLPKRFLPNDIAVVFPEKPGHAALFALPWYDRVLIGTTDHFVERVEREPKPLQEELQELLAQAQEHLSPAPSRGDVLAVFAGLRPLVTPSDQGERADSAKVPREYQVSFGRAGVCHVTGGKWTTYRQMAEEVLSQLISRGLLEDRPCQTKDQRLVGYLESSPAPLTAQSVYGSEAGLIEALAQESARYQALIHPRLPYRYAELVFAIRSEWALTLEDLLSRRTRALLLDAQATIECAPEVATLLAEELGRGDAWRAQQLERFLSVAQGYLWPAP